MVLIKASYDGDLQCTLTHDPSGSKITSDAPADIGGKAGTFSPTDMIAAGLASCMLTTIAMAAGRKEIPHSGITAEVKKEMSTTTPRRIARLATVITYPHNLTDEQKALVENAAHKCPVHLTLHPETQAPIEFLWGQA